MSAQVDGQHGRHQDLCAEAVDDQIGHIKLPAGTYKVTGQQALDYVRVRHGIGAPTGDIKPDEAPTKPSSP
ncbi:MAG: LCP family protein [Marmoricola sp.]